MQMQYYQYKADPELNEFFGTNPLAEILRSRLQESQAVQQELSQAELAALQQTQHKTIGEAFGIKHDTGKAPMSLLSREALEQTAQVLAFGAKKYAAHNWRKGFEWSRPLSAAMRHLLAFQDGEDQDAESGLSHLAHAMCCIMFVLEFEKTHPELDDRWKP